MSQFPHKWWRFGWRVNPKGYPWGMNGWKHIGFSVWFFVGYDT